MNPASRTRPAPLWPRGREGLLRSLDLVLEFGLYLYVYALFRASSLRLALTGILLVAWLLRLALDPGVARRFVAEPVVQALAVFMLLALFSVFYSPQPAAALLEFATTLGAVGWLALLVPCALRSERSLQRLLVAVLITALYLNYVQIKGIVNEYRETGALLTDIGRHRSHTLSLMFFLPFLLVLAERARGKPAWWLWGIVTLQFVLLLATVGRAALLATAVALTVWLGLRRRWRLLIAGGVALVLAGMLFAWLPESSAPWQYLQKGFSSSGRVANTWGPTMAMIAQSPWFGYGYGGFVYPQVFDAQIPMNLIDGQLREFARQLGPHNFYLEIWFHAGIFTLAAMIFLFARFSARLYEQVRGLRAEGLIGLSALAVLCAFTAHYLVHAHLGPLGPTGLRPLGFLIGLGIALQWIRAGQGPEVSPCAGRS